MKQLFPVPKRSASKKSGTTIIFQGGRGGPGGGGEGGITPEEVDSKIYEAVKNHPSKADVDRQIEIALDDYDTPSEVNTKISNALEDYTKDTATLSKLNQYSNKPINSSAVTTALSDYTKTTDTLSELDDETKKPVNSEAVFGALEAFYTADETDEQITDALRSYTKDSDTLSELDIESDKPINSEAVVSELLDNYFSASETVEEINASLEDYDTSAEVDNKIDTALEDYTPIVNIKNAEYQKLSEEEKMADVIYNIIDGIPDLALVTDKIEKGNFNAVTSNAVETALSDYYNKNSVNQLLAGYDNKSEVDGKINSALSNSDPLHTVGNEESFNSGTFLNFGNRTSYKKDLNYTVININIQTKSALQSNTDIEIFTLPSEYRKTNIPDVLQIMSITTLGKPVIILFKRDEGKFYIYAPSVISINDYIRCQLVI